MHKYYIHTFIFLELAVEAKLFDNGNRLWGSGLSAKPLPGKL